MIKAFSFSAGTPLLLAAVMLQTPSIAYAQQDCAQVQTGFVSAMEEFRTAFFEREGASGTAESVMADQVQPNAELMYEACPAGVAAAVKAGVEQAVASLTDSSRAQLVACDKALITYQGYLRRYDTQNLPSYQDYRSLLYSDIDPAAEAAIAACPQMTDLSRQASADILERQRRLDSMQDLDNAGPSYNDTRHNMEDYNDAYDAYYDE